jgi:RsiW-degrading membrane proteinase PrsW (M82 family)
MGSWALWTRSVAAILDALITPPVVVVLSFWCSSACLSHEIDNLIWPVFWGALACGSCILCLLPRRFFHEDIWLEERIAVAIGYVILYGPILYIYVVMLVVQTDSR